MSLPKYVIVTPAHNEGQMMTGLIESVVAQRYLPIRWVIVSDGSTDSTDEIVKRWSVKYPWIELNVLAQGGERNFARKVYAVKAGIERLEELDYEVLVCMDADLMVDSHYFEYLIGKLQQDSSLGIVGSALVEDGVQLYDYRYVNIEHVSGGCQVFRRQCYEGIGGYLPIKSGAIDNIAVVMARMHGWKTRTFPEVHYVHRRMMGTAESNSLRARFHYGKKDFMIGNHPVWELFRCLYQMRKKPFIVGGLSLAAGYFLSVLRRVKRPVSDEFVRFYRAEQLRRLGSAVSRILGRGECY